MNSVFKFLCVVGLLVTSVACQPDHETSPPYFGRVTVNTSEGELELEAPRSLSLRIQCFDDTQLGQLQIEVHHDFDGHSHGKIISTPLIYSETVNLSGKSATVNKVVEVPFSGS